MSRNKLLDFPVKITQRETAYLTIRDRMVSGSLLPGARLSPAHLARDLGISHIPVREAISQLSTEGWVVHLAHKGAFVRRIERQELVDLIEMRSIMECHGASKAARHISKTQLAELDTRWEELCRIAAEFKQLPPGTDLRELLGEWLLADLSFHMVLLKAAGNRHVMRVMNEARMMTQMFGYRTDHPAAWTNPPSFAESNLAVHRAVYEAVRAQDAKAAKRAMLQHMKLARKNLLARFDWMQRQSDLAQAGAVEFPESMRELVDGLQQRMMTDLPPNTREDTCG